jgi:TRAP-type C4-dicarboxylate transport system permease small subunit
MVVHADRARLSSLKRRLEPLLGAGGIACEAALVIMMLLIAAEVAVRSLFNYSLQFTDELSGYLLVAVTFLGISISLKEGAVFRVDVLYRRLAARVRNALELVFQMLALVFTVLLDYQVIRLVISSYERDVTAPTLLATPLYVPQIIMPVGVSLMALLQFVGICVQVSDVLAGRRDERGVV